MFPRWRGTAFGLGFVKPTTEDILFGGRTLRRLDSASADRNDLDSLTRTGRKARAGQARIHGVRGKRSDFRKKQVLLFSSLNERICRTS